MILLIEILGTQMSLGNIFIVLFIHLILPLIGLIIYLRLLAKLKKENLAKLGIDFFILFITYGGLLMSLLTALFWKYSGMAALGAFYLIILAPILMGIIAYNNHKVTSVSKYHKLAFQAALYYLTIIPVMLVVSYFFRAYI